MNKLEIEKEIYDNISGMFPEGVFIGFYDNLPAPCAARLTQNMKLFILINEKVFNELMERSGVNATTLIQHEFLHYLLGHLSINHTSSKTEEEHIKENIAKDCEVNSELPELWDLGPECCCTHRHFEAPPHLFWERYLPFIPDEKVKQHVTTCSLALSEEEMKKLGEMIEQEMEAQGEKASLDPPQVQKKNERRPPKAYPPSILQQLDKIMASEVPGYMDKEQSWVKPHKFLPLRRGKIKSIQPKILVAVDCSGSTQGNVLQEFFQAVTRLLSDLRCEILEFSESICHVGKHPSGNLWGGGTNFRCVQEYVWKHDYDCVIWFTDGEDMFHKPRGEKNIVVLFNQAQINENVAQVGKCIALK